MTQRIASVRTQLEQILRGRIEQGHYAADSRLPAEHKLAEELGVPEPFVRQMLLFYREVRHINFARLARDGGPI